MRQHLLNQLIVGPVSFAQSQFCERGALFTQQFAGSHVHPLQQVYERALVRRGFHILDDCGSTPALRMRPSVFREVPQAVLW